LSNDAKHRKQSRRPRRNGPSKMNQRELERGFRKDTFLRNFELKWCGGPIYRSRSGIDVQKIYEPNGIFIVPTTGAWNWRSQMNKPKYRLTFKLFNSILGHRRSRMGIIGRNFAPF